MGPKKSSKPNAFLVFAQDLMKQHGRKYKSMEEACTAAGPLWQKMAKEQRRPYEDRANAQKGEAGGTRYTSDGLSVDELTRQELEKQKFENKAREDIRYIITNALNRNVLDKEPFYLIHCNIFYYHVIEDKYYPAEIAVLSFNLKEGVQPENVFHRLINPGPPKVGYRFAAMQHSEETHKLTVPVEDGCDNQEMVIDELLEFLAHRSPRNKPRIFYADKSYIRVIQNVFKAWASIDEEMNYCYVYSLPLMFYYLRNAAARDEVWPSIAIPDRELEKDSYAYFTELACPTHSVDNPVFCSRSIVVRYAYAICRQCCPDLQIPLVEGRHLPVLPDVESKQGASSSSSGSSSGAIPKPRKGGSRYGDSDSEGLWETSSVASEVSDAPSFFSNDFPSLGESSSQRSSSKSSVSSVSTVKSYSSAANKNSSSRGVENYLQELSLNESTPSSAGGRGRGLLNRHFRRANDSPPVGGLSMDNEFPSLGRGRGLRVKPVGKEGDSSK